MTKAEAQEKAIVALTNAEFYSDGTSVNYNRVESFAALGLAWATLANGLPAEVNALDARPFREVIQ